MKPIKHKNFLLKDKLEKANLELQQKIKELKNTQKALVEHSSILEAFFQHIHSAVAILDRNFNFIRVNEVYAKADERDVSDFPGKNHFELYPSDEVKAIFEQVVQTKKPFETFARPFTYAHSPERGVSYWDWSLVPIFDASGEVELLIFSLNNVTERKRYEKEMARLDRLNLVGQMAAGIGHEIRNPVTAIRGFLQILREKTECQQYSEYFNLMIGELDRANSIITEFLDMARNKPAEMQRQNLNNVLKALSPLIKADAMNSNKNVEMELADIPDILLNEKEIRQLILNLTRNGLEAMSPGGFITIKTLSSEGEVILAVQDQGPGIDPDVLEKIGTPFFTTKEQGTGLGMATCYSIAARHNATVQIETGSSGTTFFVCFKQ